MSRLVKTGLIQMSKTIDDFFDDIDAARTIRVRELSEIKRLLGAPAMVSDPMGVQSKALVVLSYAAWEGFYDDCVEAYCNFMKVQGSKVSDVGWGMLVGVLSAEFMSLRDRRHSLASRKRFVDDLQQKLSADFNRFDRSVISAQSNLDWDKLEQSFGILNFDLNQFQKYRNRLNKELVSWRHGVAHGSAPSLGSLDAAGHISLVADLMMLVSDAFQAAMVEQA